MLNYLKHFYKITWTRTVTIRYAKSRWRRQWQFIPDVLIFWVCTQSLAQFFHFFCTHFRCYFFKLKVVSVLFFKLFATLVTIRSKNCFYWIFILLYVRLCTFCRFVVLNLSAMFSVLKFCLFEYKRCLTCIAWYWLTHRVAGYSVLCSHSIWNSGPLRSYYIKWQ